MDIYDRANWPSASSNPLIVMLNRGDDWYSNEEIVAALGLSPKRALLSQGTIFKNQIRDDDSALVARGWLTPGKTIGRNNGGTVRVFSRRALVIAAMRTETVNAAAFRDWAAGQLAAASSAGAVLSGL